MTAVTELPTRRAATTEDLHPLLAERWSPRSFDPAAVVTDEQLRRLLEAARWAPSAANRQPWRLAVARRGSALHAAISESLLHSNRLWGPDAAVLLVGFARTTVDGRENPIARYDLGQAVAHLTVQAAAEGLVTHQMGGFDADLVRDAVGFSAELEPVVVVAAGHLAAPERLPEPLRQREVAPRERRPLAELVLLDEPAA